jgi:hypothetical protein
MTKPTAPTRTGRRRVRRRSDGVLGWLTGLDGEWKVWILWDDEAQTAAWPDDGGLFEILGDDQPMTEPTQAELDGIREPKPARWLYLAEAALDELAMAALLLGVVKRLPGLPADGADLFARAQDRLARCVMQEVGRVAWEAGEDRAIDRMDKMAEEARRRTVTAEAGGA